MRHIMTPDFDKLMVTVPMTTATLFGLRLWRRSEELPPFAKLMHRVSTMYLAISVPFHVRTFITGNVDILERFPENYSYYILPLQTTLLVAVWNSRFPARPRPVLVVDSADDGADEAPELQPA